MTYKTLKTFLFSSTFLGLACLYPAAVQADSIVLSNGDTITGEITGRTLTAYIIKTDLMGEVVIARDKVREVILPKQAKVQGLVKKTKVTPEQALEVHELQKVEPAAGEQAFPYSIAGVKNGVQDVIKQIKWSGEVNAGALLQTGNTQKNAIRLDAEVQARREKDRFIGRFEYDRAEDDGTLTEDETEIEGVYDYFFKPKWFYNADVKFTQDDISNIDLRTEAGFGIGYQQYESDTLNLKYIMGAEYIREDFANNGGVEEDIAATWQLDYDQKFYDEILTLFHNHDVEVPIGQTDAFTFESETGLKVPVAVNLDGTFKVEFDWDNDPALGVKEDDTKYTLSLGYSW